MKKILLIQMLLVLAFGAIAKEDSYTLKSPDGRLVTHIVANGLGGLTYDLEYDGEQLMLPSYLGLFCSSSKAEVNGMTVKRTMKRTVDEIIASPFTRQATMRDHYNELTLKMYEGFSVVFRAYNEGVAYRYVWESAPCWVWHEAALQADSL